ncbi:hypothetical protein EIP91_005592 [Steccherinum ochraceum]|uniref:AAA+ ATPase domain-containing protein n=1 Tax=Steccherinum ochraceum TaxID=92696 RepID=A0A4R0R725_9APHY|nr:hypothetical protein EIP91_005592 [Steccherinum ochraceum]
MSNRHFSDILQNQFHSAVSNPELNLIRHLKKVHGSESQLVSTTICTEALFPLEEYLKSIGTHPDPVSDESYYTFDFAKDKNEQAVFPRISAGILEFMYENTPFRVYIASWTCGYNDYCFYGLVFTASTDDVGRELASEVYKYGSALKEEIWVYEGGEWAKSSVLFHAIKRSAWEDVILDEQLKEDLRRDTQTFFESKEVYGALGITWKRGLLLMGPPGNGKTETIKALLNKFGYAALYVKSFSTPFQGPEHGIRLIFNHARKHAPCVLILEDLDSMVTPKVRSYLLNELDGLAQNSGILTIATTNHPERIDDAILNRPSRFDVKYEFGLPSLDLRKRFALRWVDKVQSSNTAASSGEGLMFGDGEGDRIAGEVAKRTEGWSFAFLKELFVSYLLRLAHDRSLRKSKIDTANVNPHLEDVLMDQIERLSAQILKLQASAGKDSVEEDDHDEDSSSSSDSHN